MSYKKLKVKQFPQNNPSITAETRFWDSYEKCGKHVCQAKVSSVSFCSASPYDVAVTSSSRVEIFNGSTGALKKTVSRFKGPAMGGSFRGDGKLLVAGGQKGIVRVFDLASRDVLRAFRNVHTLPVHVSRFSADNTHVLSASDDKTMRRLDIPTETALGVFEGHTDYVRAGLELPSSPDTWVSGSYDHTVKTWDVRSQQNVLTFDHSEPVECLLALPHGGLVLSAGGNTIKVWDLLAGKLLQTLSNHQKTVTSLAANGDGTRILSGGLDHHVKVYDVTSFDVTHSFKFQAPVMGLGLSPAGGLLAVGLLDGTLVLRKRAKETDGAANKFGAVPAAQGRGAKGRYFMRGEHYVPKTEDFAVEQQGKKQQLKAYDRYLKKFQYHAALDAALSTNRGPLVITVLEELIRRGGLRLALGDRDQHGLEPLLNFTLKHIDNPQYADLLVDLANIILDMYTSVLGQSVRVDELVLALKQKVEEELAFQTNAVQLAGTLEMVLASAASGATQPASNPSPATAAPSKAAPTRRAVHPNGEAHTELNGNHSTTTSSNTSGTSGSSGSSGTGAAMNGHAGNGKAAEKPNARRKVKGKTKASRPDGGVAGARPSKMAKVKKKEKKANPG